MIVVKLEGEDSEILMNIYNKLHKYSYHKIRNSKFDSLDLNATEIHILMILCRNMGMKVTEDKK